MFLEFANVFGHYYGTPTKETLEALNQDYTLLLEIDWQGAEQIRLKRPGSLSVFLLPPSKEELKKRLTSRAMDSTDQIELRFQEAIKDIEQYSYFDRVIVNMILSPHVRKLCLWLTAPTQPIQPLAKKHLRSSGVLLG
tara:strand:- start:1999 stop:2412 length:414 start_codon:yes stop_codon:yes gene_type:complete